MADVVRALTVTHSRSPRVDRVEEAPGTRRDAIAVVSPRATARAAAAAASCRRNCCPAICTPERHAASTSTTDGKAIANSAVTLPRSFALARDRQRTSHEIREHAPHFV